MELVEPYGWHNLDARGIGSVRSRLSDFETMTWAEILVEGKKFHHAVSVEQLCKEARDRLNHLFRGNIDVDELVSLRLSGKERVWGILDNGVLALLWWDPQHQVCPSLLRYT
jgi:hypothetical protein